MTREQMLDQVIESFEDVHRNLKAAREAPPEQRKVLAESAMQAADRARRAAERFYRYSPL